MHMSVFLVFLGILLLGMTPSLCIIGILSNSIRTGLSKQLLIFSIACQTIVVLLPLSLFLFTFLYVGVRETPVFIPYAAVWIAGIALFCIFASIVANIVYASTYNKSAGWGVLLQFICVGIAFCILFFTDKVLGLP